MTISFDLYCVDITSTLKDAIGVISRNLNRCAIVLGEDKRVIGVVSEGDVLRFLLNDISLYAPLSQITQPSFRYLKEKNYPDALLLIKKFGITLIPVIDDNFHLTGIITLFDVLDHLEPGVAETPSRFDSP